MLSVAIVNLGPCSELPPHFHPRASNYVVSILGKIVTWMYWENGANTITTTLNQFEATLFPRGSIHQMANPSKCWLSISLSGSTLLTELTCSQHANMLSLSPLSTAMTQAPPTSAASSTTAFPSTGSMPLSGRI